MHLALLLMLIPAVLLADVAIHYVLRRSGFDELQIDELRLKRLVVWALFLWSLSSWRSEAAGHARMIELAAEEAQSFQRCFADVEPRLSIIEDRLADFWTLYGDVLGPAAVEAAGQ